ncbi:MAG: hypothetical protein NZ521_03305, partial [Flammeovirgaceae bacterium]|nr:hypothetical protein [Flammeovirgaceae bacterium]MDW8288825.1 hypothetical protein [Flammeovirgaceae bacterium]
MNLSLSFLLFSFFSLSYFSVKGNNAIEKIIQEIENAPSEHEQINIIDKTLDGMHDFQKKACNVIESIKEKFDEKNPKHAFALSYIYHLLSIHCTTEKKPAYYQKAIDFIRKTKVPCYEEYYKVSYEIYYYSGTLQIKQEDIKEKIKETFNQSYLNLEKKGCAAYFYLIAYREATAAVFQENMSESLSNL